MPTKIIYNSDWAKENISMPDLLSCFGHQAVKTTKHGNEYWYISPFRYEKEPSFHTSYLGGKWIWNDFGRGDVKGSGTVIGFLQLHERVGVGDSLKILKELFPNKGRAVSLNSLRSTPLFKNITLNEKEKSNDPVEQTLVVREVKDKIWDKTLIGYLAGERKIDYKLAVKYLKHIRYENVKTGKLYDTLGFENDTGDFECRDKYFKGILKNPEAIDRNTAKNISYIPGQEKDRVAVFEGFMDFLTVLTIKSVPVLPVDVVILNSGNLRGCAIDFIKQSDYKNIYTFFDNDSPGEKTTQIFIEELGQRVEAQNHLYKGFNDYNQFLQTRASKALVD